MTGRKGSCLPPATMHDTELDRVIVGDGSGEAHAKCRAACGGMRRPRGGHEGACDAAPCLPPRPVHAPLRPSGPPHPPVPARLPGPAPAVLVGCKISNSVLGECTYVGRGTRIEHSLVLGNGAWTNDAIRDAAREAGQTVYGVGEPMPARCPLQDCEDALQRMRG